MHNKFRYQIPDVRCQLSDNQMSDGNRLKNLKSGNLKTEIRYLTIWKSGFSVIELIVAIGLLGLLAASVILAINPVERAKVAQDDKVKDEASWVAESITEFYIAKGRLPWADDLGSAGPTPPLSWRSVASPEVGVCSDQTCGSGGELITEGKLPGGFFTTKSVRDSQLYIAKGSQASDKTYVCYVPQSDTVRKATGKLYKIKQGEQIPPSGVPDDCPLSPTWTGEDVCYSCISK